MAIDNCVDFNRQLIVKEGKSGNTPEPEKSPTNEATNCDFLAIIESAKTCLLSCLLWAAAKETRKTRALSGGGEEVRGRMRRGWIKKRAARRSVQSYLF